MSAVVLREGEGDHSILQSPHLRGAVPSWDIVCELRLLHIQVCSWDAELSGLTYA